MALASKRLAAIAPRRAGLALLLAASAPAGAVEPQYYGTWLIAETQVAPWASEAEFSAAEARQLVGRKVVYRKTRIDGPSPLACTKPRYRLLDVPPEGLFQGGLTRPSAQAAALGLRHPTIKTLETGCEGWIAFHFVDSGTALFALNNRIYTLRRQ